jgi:hypothetical protein
MRLHHIHKYSLTTHVFENHVKRKQANRRTDITMSKRKRIKGQGIIYKTLQKTRKIQVQASDRHNNVVGLNRPMRFEPAPLDNRISNGHIYLNK